MNGLEHYQEAERLLASAEKEATSGRPRSGEVAMPAFAAAQVHATLALAWGHVAAPGRDTSAGLRGTVTDWGQYATHGNATFERACP